MAKAAAGSEVHVRFAPRLALDRRILLVLRRLDITEPPRLIALALDATLQHAREAGLEAARAEAEVQNAGKSRFLANMSHELRTPLNAVIGFSDIMRQRLFGPIPDRYAGYAQSIHEAGGHLLDLINDVLDVSRIEAARYDLNIERFDVREMVSEALALVRVQADDKGVDLAAVLPPAPLTVAADRRALKQIALNLLSNAVKFTPTGGSVTVRAEALGSDLELTVADTGVGVAPEDLARLGRPLRTGRRRRTEGTGHGPGLVAGPFAGRTAPRRDEHRQHPRRRHRRHRPPAGRDCDARPRRRRGRGHPTRPQRLTRSGRAASLPPPAPQPMAYP